MTKQYFKTITLADGSIDTVTAGLKAAVNLWGREMIERGGRIPKHGVAVSITCQMELVEDDEGYAGSRLPMVALRCALDIPDRDPDERLGNGG